MMDKQFEFKVPPWAARLLVVSLKYTIEDMFGYKLELPLADVTTGRYEAPTQASCQKMLFRLSAQVNAFEANGVVGHDPDDIEDLRNQNDALLEANELLLEENRRLKSELANKGN